MRFGGRGSVILASGCDGLPEVVSGGALVPLAGVLRGRWAGRGRGQPGSGAGPVGSERNRVIALVTVPAHGWCSARCRSRRRPVRARVAGTVNSLVGSRLVPTAERAGRSAPASASRR